MADEHCVRIGEHSRAFYFLSDATADNFICGQKTVGNHNRMELLNPNVFSALPPFEKTKNVKGVTERLVALNRYAEIDANWLRSKNYTKLCLPEIEQMSDEPFEVGYAFNADHNLGDVELSAAVERVFEVYPDVLLGYLEVTGVQKSFHVFEVNVEAGCWDAFFIYKGEDGSVPYKLNEGYIFECLELIPFHRANKIFTIINHHLLTRLLLCACFTIQWILDCIGELFLFGDFFHRMQSQMLYVKQVLRSICSTKVKSREKF